ncbi:MAG: hypothetical protein M1364_00180 [Candidatus Marsarchaeota archaeon]|jgi:large subunit ribosomal protein L32e|nr:hypothetical protein [Candidatus Marsarchaeota archaeon]
MKKIIKKNGLSKKKHPTFNVPGYGIKKRKHVMDRWRKQRGIDNKKRIKKDFMGAEPTIGYKTPDPLIGIRANGRRAILVRNQEDLKSALENPDINDFDVTIASAVGKKKRISIIELARKNNIKVTNGAHI